MNTDDLYPHEMTLFSTAKKPAINDLGQTISAGDFVAYPVRQGSGMWMSYGVVAEIAERKSWYQDEPVQVLKVMIASGPERWDHDKRIYVKENLKPRKKTIGVIKNVVVLDLNTIKLPEEAMTIFRTAQGLAKVLNAKVELNKQYGPLGTK